MSLSIIFNELLYRPILNFLVILQNIIPGHDFGLSIIVLTVLTRLLLWPLASKSIRSQKALQELQPELNAIKEKYKGDQVKQSQAMMDLYKSKKINPAAGCLPVLIQLPFLIALYYAFMAGFDQNAIQSALYPSVHLSDGINFRFLGFIDLSQKSVYLAAVAGILQYFQTKMIMPPKPASGSRIDVPNTKSDDFASMMNTQMLYVMPVITIFIASTFPSGLALYWVTTTAFSIIQQHYVTKNNQTVK